ncbi:MAG: 2-dehydro-3-deoxyphosphooctonate aldolase, partial [Chlamydiota bacterium]
MKKLDIANFLIGPDEPLAFLCGPCVIESESHALSTAEKLVMAFRERPVSFIFKASYDKANRSSVHSFRGPGLDEGLKILQRVEREFGIPVVTDVHSPEEAKIVGHVLSMIQIPAFLCRQTDLLIAAAQTPAAVNIKKGQFLAPWDMKNVVEKFEALDHRRLLLTDRGVSFGYNCLISDMRAIPAMQALGYPVCFDASHSTQMPGALGQTSGGDRRYIPTLAKSAVAAGCNALFLEVHHDPSNAKSDATTVWPLEQLNSLLDQLEKLY